MFKFRFFFPQSLSPYVKFSHHKYRRNKSLQFAIEFFNNDQRCFGSEIDTEELQGLTYKKLEQFTGYYGLTKLLDVVDSFKIRSWDGKNNFDYTIICEENGNVVINQIFVGIL